jgi:small subunit ribosomal protein S8
MRNLAAQAGTTGNFEQGGKHTMQITDPIADMLTRIRNAGSARHDTVDVPSSKMKKAIAEILLEEGYIKSFQLIDDGTQGVIRITLKYLPGKEKAIQGLRRVSKPGLRVYAGADELPQVLRGLGIAIISTSKGIMTDKKARAAHVGGEVLAFVW